MAVRSLAAGAAVAVALASCGAENADKVAAQRCSAAAAEIATIRPPRSAPALTAAAKRAAGVIGNALRSPDDKLDRAQPAARAARDALRDLGDVDPRDVLAREEAVADVEAHGAELRRKVDPGCAKRVEAGVRALRTAHFRLAIAPLAHAVDPKKVRLDDDSLLGTGTHFLFAVDQYHSAVTQTLEHAQTARAPAAARSANRAWLAALRRLGDHTSELFNRGWPGASPARREIAALRRQAAAVERAYRRLGRAL